MKKIKTYFIGVLSGILITASMPLAAKVTKETAQVIYNNFSLYVEGKKTTIEPLILNGTTYVPLKSVSEALGVPLRIEENDYYLGEKNSNDTNVVDLMDYSVEHPFFKDLLSVKSKYYNTDYVQILQKKYPITNLVTSNGTAADILILDNKFKTLKATIGIDDRKPIYYTYGYLGIYDNDTKSALYTTDDLNSESDKIAKSDGASYKKITRGANPAIEIEIDVSNINQLLIDLGKDMCMFNIQLIKK